MRHALDTFRFRAPRGGGGWIEPDRAEWSIVVGDRIRRLRTDKALSLVQLARRVEQAGGGRSLSPGHISKIERGWANATMSSYLALATALEVPPWRLLGPEEVQKEVTDGELTLIQYLRHVGLPPHEAIAVLATARPGSRPARDAGP